MFKAAHTEVKKESEAGNLAMTAHIDCGPINRRRPCNTKRKDDPLPRPLPPPTSSPSVSVMSNRQRTHTHTHKLSDPLINSDEDVLI